MLNRETYLNYISRFKKVESYLRSHSMNPRDVAYNICELREYYPERMSDTLISAGFMYIKNNSVYENLRGAGDDLALFSKEGKFLLENRFIFPVRDMLGNTIALIGWFPDSKKYITTPSALFSKSCLFYGMEELGMTGIGKDYFLVEGIFDRLSLNSLGFNAISCMGIDSTRYKQSLYPLFKSLTAIPDNDVEGRKVLQNDLWQLPTRSKYFKWVGDKSKDIDRLVNAYDKDDITNLLKEVMSDRNRIVTKEV